MLARAPMTGTNKLGLLLVLLDTAPQKISDDQPISKYELASRYLSMHWEHGRPFGSLVLRQSSVNKKRNDDSSANDSTVMLRVKELRELLTELGCGHLRDKPLEVVDNQIGSTKHADDWDRAMASALTSVRDAVWKNPVSRLQRLPGSCEPFLYEFEDGQIEFLPGVAEMLTKYAGILRPLIEFRFSELVARINRAHLAAPENDIHEHLFGVERSMPPTSMRNGLIELQNNRCIFSGKRLTRRAGSVDHVIPWSRNRLSHIENFVMTTRTVNSDKSNSLLSPDLLRGWLEHVSENSGQLEQLANDHRWPTDFSRVGHVALSIYEVLDPSAGVWHVDEGIRPLGEAGRAEATTLLQRALPGARLDVKARRFGQAFQPPASAPAVESGFGRARR